jgi:TonB family protein
VKHASSRETARHKARTRESMGISIVLHLIVFLWVGFTRASGTELAGLTEITFVDMTDPAGEPNAAPPMARETTSSAPMQEVSLKATREAKATESFERAREHASSAPGSQSSHAVTDLLDKRLDAIDRKGNSTTRIASLIPAPNVGIPAPAGLPGPGDRPNAVAATLRREAVPVTTGTAPVALRRLEARSEARPVMAAALIDAPAEEAPKPATTTTPSQGARNLAGANLVGPVADRQVLRYRVPDYPDWAKRDAIEGSVTLYFFVLPNGRVKENVLVERTSGFSDFDDRAVLALLEWKFVALPSSPASSEQWGRITFNYRLSDAQ